MKINEAMLGINTLEGYNIKGDVAQPLWGPRLGLYDPLEPAFNILTKDEWKVYDQIAEGKLLSEVKNAGVAKTLRTLLANHIVLDTTEQSSTKKHNSIKKATVNRTKNSEIYVKLTEGCNYSCPGCATSMDVVKPAEAVTLDQKTLELLLESYFRSSVEKGFYKTKVKWAGGEPTLANAFPLIVNSQPFLKGMLKKYPKLTIDQVIITNGVFMTKEKVDFAKKHHMHISVSLWGTTDLHDKIRRPRSKKEGYPTIVENIKYIIQSGISFNVNHVFSSLNSAHFADFLDTVWNPKSATFIGKGVTYKPINLGIAIHRAQTPHDAILAKQELQKLITDLRKGFAKIYELLNSDVPLQPLNRFDYLDVFGLSNRTCGAGVNYVGVGPEGAAPCHEGLFAMQHNIDRIKAGENIFDVANEEYVKTGQLLETANMNFGSTRKAFLMAHGGAGCPRLAKLEHNGQMGYASSTSEIYDALFEEVLALEALRQLKFELKELK
jgi:sulfatase maturation enzyme AslB (radical SAM superfamily)